MGNLFGMTGIRGVAGVYPLEPYSIIKFGMALSKVFYDVNGKLPKVLIGRDTRVSGYMIANALTSSFLFSGCDVILAGVIPTPGVAYFQDDMRADIGIAITASHNPYQDNGIKVFLPNGNRMPEDMQLKIVELMKEPFEPESNKEIGKIIKIKGASERYIDHLKSFFNKNLCLNGLKIGLDLANGSASFIGESLLSELGADVEVRGDKPNGKNINAGFGSVYPEVLSKLVIDNNLDLGIALDGDGDRIVLVDECGKILDGDEILAILAKYFKKCGMLKNNSIVATVMSNMGLDLALKSDDIIVKRSRVGEVHVLEEMQKYDLSLGGEQSGHVIIKECGQSGDGLCVALKILEIMLTEGKSLRELQAGYKSFPQKLKSFTVIAKPNLDTIEGYKELKSKILDDFKDEGRILIRYSETENKIRIMVEHKDEKICDETIEKLTQFFEEKIGV